jgi:hypothetical protein
VRLPTRLRLPVALLALPPADSAPQIKPSSPNYAAGQAPNRVTDSEASARGRQVPDVLGEADVDVRERRVLARCNRDLARTSAWINRCRGHLHERDRGDRRRCTGRRRSCRLQVDWRRDMRGGAGRRGGRRRVQIDRLRLRLRLIAHPSSVAKASADAAPGRPARGPSAKQPRPS